MDSQHGNSITRRFADGTAVQKPLVLDLKLESSYRQRLSEIAYDEHQSVFLTISGLAPSASSGVSIRCFLNLPTASLRTEADDPHFVGSFSFFDVTDKTREFTQRFDLDRVIRELADQGLWNDTSTFKLTLLLSPVNDQQKLDANMKVAITAITLEIAESTK